MIRRSILEPKDRPPTDDEVALFIRQCLRTQLDPFDRQIYAAFRWDSRSRRERMSVQATIDGFRLVAERSDKYLGQDGPFWCGPDGKWVDVWLDDAPPSAAKVGVWKQGAKSATYSVALFKEYAQTNKQGALTGLWPSMPSNQLAKCAEALALRRTFPDKLSGIYTTEEMGQADSRADAEAQLTALPVATGTGQPPVTSEDGRVEYRGDVGTPPTPTPERAGDSLATKDEIDALRELIRVTETAEPFVRMTLIEFGIEDVGTLEEMFPKLTVAQALHVMTKINDRMAA